MERGGIHWFAVACLLKYLGCHVPRCATRCRQDVEGLFIHDSAQAKVGNEEVCIVFWSSEQ